MGDMGAVADGDRVLFLDVDGVLNGHERHANGFCGIDCRKVELLNELVAAVGCRIVLVSAWRYMILNGAMTLEGFRHLLAINGASQQVRDALIGHLPPDGSVNDLHDRGKLARAWLVAAGVRLNAVALDDGGDYGLDLGYRVMGVPLVQPVSHIGLDRIRFEQVVRLFDQMEPKLWG